MGAKVSVCNLTAIVLNVALKHLGPVYYTNQLMPDECATFNTGRVWFTVEARVWSNGTNNYTDAMLALPIVGMHFGVNGVAGLVGSLAAIEGNNNLTAKEKADVGKAILPSRIFPFIPAAATAIAGAVLNEQDKPDKRLITSKHGVYIKPGKIVNIVGGPEKSAVTLTKNQRNGKLIGQQFDLRAVFEPIKIEESDIVSED